MSVRGAGLPGNVELSGGVCVGVAYYVLDRRILILRLFFSDTVFCNKAITMNSNLKVNK